MAAVSVKRSIQMIYNRVYGERQTSNSCDSNFSNLQIKQVQITACAEFSLVNSERQ